MTTDTLRISVENPITSRISSLRETISSLGVSERLMASLQPAGQMSNNSCEWENFGQQTWDDGFSDTQR